MFLEKIHAPAYAVKFPEASGGGYMGILESIHQLHCVVNNLIARSFSLKILVNRKVTDFSRLLTVRMSSGKTYIPNITEIAANI